MLQQPNVLHAAHAADELSKSAKKLCTRKPRIHCLTNAVTMNDVANVLLSIGASAIMAQCSKEAAEITELCQGTLLNTGTPSGDKFDACRVAGMRANEIGHPLVLDPVGVGASTYRLTQVRKLLSFLHPNLIRCNLEEALTLLSFSSSTNSAFQNNSDLPCVTSHGGVESGIDANQTVRAQTAANLAKAYQTTVLLSGSTDVISDGSRTVMLAGGDARSLRITGSGCMLSALCAAFLAAGEDSYTAAKNAGILWKLAAEYAGRKTEEQKAGFGSFHALLFDAVSLDTATGQFALQKFL